MIVNVYEHKHGVPHFNMNLDFEWAISSIENTQKENIFEELFQS